MRDPEWEYNGGGRPREQMGGAFDQSTGDLARGYTAHDLLREGTFVGRQEELAQMVRCLSRAEKGKGHVVSLVGEPGIGKTRLVLEFIKTASAHGYGCYKGQCIPVEPEVSYRPIREILKKMLGTSAGDQVAEIRKKIHDCLAELSIKDHVSGAALLLLLGIEDKKSIEVLDPYGAERLHETFFMIMNRLSGTKVMVLIVEDIQWIDKASVGLLDSFIERIKNSPVIVCLTQREGFAQPWSDKPYFTQISLTEMDPSEADLLLDSLLAKPLRDSALRQLVQEKSRGNPLYIEELVRFLASSGILAISPQGCVATTPPEKINIPDRLEELIRSRIHSLPELPRVVLQEASVIGASFSMPLLRTAESGVDVDSLNKALNHLSTHDFVYRDASSTPDEDESVTDNLVLDLGYHYFGSLRHPRQMVPTVTNIYNPAWNTNYPSAYGAKIKTGWNFDIASYNLIDGTAERAITAYAGPWVSGAGWSGQPILFVLLLYHEFRDEAPNPQPYNYDVAAFIGGWEGSPRIHPTGIWGVDMAASKRDGADAVLYVACTANFQYPTPAPTPTPEEPVPSPTLTPEMTAVPYKAEVHVYRYDPTNGTYPGPSRWTEIACFSEQGTKAFSTDKGTYVDVALAPKGDDLYVFWSRQYWNPPGVTGMNAGIYGKRIPDAATRSSGQGLTMPSGYILDMSTLNNPPDDYNLVLDADWDEQLHDINANWGPRILFVQPAAPPGAQKGVQHARVPLNNITGEPDPILAYDTIAADTGIDFGFPSLSLNNSGLGDTRGFAAFMKGLGAADSERAFWIEAGGDDEWEQNVEVIPFPASGTFTEMPGVTYRAFGTARYSGVRCEEGTCDNTFFTNTELVHEHPIDYMEYSQSRLATNVMNSTDIFAAARFYDPTNHTDHINLFQLDP